MSASRHLTAWQSVDPGHWPFYLLVVHRIGELKQRTLLGTPKVQMDPKTCEQICLVCHNIVPYISEGKKLI